MTVARIKLAPETVISSVYFSKGVPRGRIYEDNQYSYIVAATIQTKKIGEDAAEEMFDLTNNPGRDSERAILYGRQRSVSVGDVIEVDGVNYFCDSVGWIKI